MFLAFGLWQLIIILVFLAICIVVPIVALVDILKHNFKGQGKLTWVLVIFFFNILGAIIYFIVGKKQRIKNTDEQS